MSDKYWIEYLAKEQVLSYETFLETRLVEKDKRIAALEAVAEAAIPIVNNYGDNNTYDATTYRRWYDADEALRAAGYLGEGE
jgi:hypothetical protein